VHEEKRWLTRFLSSSQVYYATSPVAIRWSAPETMENSKTTKASDIFGLAVTFNELYAHGALPFGDTCASNLAVLSAVLMGNRPTRAVAMPDDVFGVVETMWEQEPNGRPAIGTVVKQLSRLLEASVADASEQLYSFIPGRS
jgi:Protein tyrosine and serine/threonine kinase